MRSDSDGQGRGLQALRRAVGGSLLGRLALANIAVVVLAAAAAGVGVRQFASLVIIQGDMMTMDKLPQFLQQTGYWLAGVTAATALAGALVAWLLFRQIMRPLGRIERVAAAVAGGDYSQRLNEPGSDELGRLAGAIDAMTGSLARVEQLRRDLIANVAHELRTPLTATQGLLFAMRDGLLAPDERNLEAAAEELARLTRLVEAIHQLSLSDALPTGGLSLGTLDLGALTAEVTTGMLPLFEQKGIAVTVETAAVQVMGHRDALVQVLVNLLDNAAKYTPEGGWVSVSCSPVGEVAVRNSGPGIAATDLPHVFERFYRGEKSRSRETGGAGIGLAIVKNMIEAHRGVLWVKSDNHVTTVAFRIPRK